MNQPKTLIIVAADFPHGYGEPYLEDELQVLSPSFERIFIVIPESYRVDNSKALFGIPANARVIYLNTKISAGHKLKAVTKIFTRRAVNHLKTVVSFYRLRLNTHIVKSMLAYEASDLAFREMLLDELRERKVAFNGLYLYSYWLTNYTFSLARIKKEFPSVKVFTRAHGWDVYFERHQPPYLPYRDFIIPQLDKVFPISENGRGYLLAKVPGAHAEKLITARLGTDEQELIPYQPGNGRLRLLTLTFIMQVKHLELLKEALTATALPVDWHHIGGGDDAYARSFLQSVHESLKNKGTIRFYFHGTLDKKQIENFFASTPLDLIVNTSYSEGIPVALMQAMSFGIPAIAPRVGGIPEMIEEGINGFLMSVAPSAEELNGLLKKYYQLETPAKQQLRRNACALWKEKFHNRKNYEKFAAEILKDGSA